MKLNRLILFGFLILTGLLNAQTDFRPGYIINTTSDTLYGEIDYRGDLLMSSTCKFKDADNTIKEYSPADITAFRFIDNKYYISKPINGTNVFLEYLIKGKINIYYMRDDRGNHYYLQKENVKLTEIPYEQGIKYVDDKQVFYESKKHIGLLIYCMQDAPEFQSRIQSLKKPTHQNLIKLAEDYHNVVCKGDKCIIYEKKQPLFKVNFEVVGGVINFENVKDLNDKFYFQGGVLAHFWMPRTNEKLYFRTGLLYSKLEFISKKSNFYKIPCHIEYVYPRGFIKPRLSYGLNFYYPSYRSVSFNFGANIKLNNSLYLSATSDIEFNPLIMVLPHDLLSYSLHIGIIFNL